MEKLINNIIPIEYIPSKKEEAIKLLEHLEKNTDLYQTVLPSVCKKIIIGKTKVCNSLCLSKNYKGDFETFAKLAFGDYQNIFILIQNDEIDLGFNILFELARRIEISYRNLGLDLKHNHYKAQLFLEFTKMGDFHGYSIFEFIALYLYTICRTTKNYEHFNKFLFQEKEQYMLFHETYLSMLQGNKLSFLNRNISASLKLVKKDFPFILNHLSHLKIVLDNQNLNVVNEEIDIPSITYEECMELVIQILQTIDSTGELKKRFLKGVKDETICIWDINNKSQRNELANTFIGKDIRSYKLFNLQPGPILNCPFQGNISDVMKIIHEFFHLIEEENKPLHEINSEAKEIFQEFPSIFYEKFAAFYLANHFPVSYESLIHQRNVWTNQCTFNFDLLYKCYCTFLKKGRISSQDINLPTPIINSLNRALLRNPTFIKEKVTYAFSNALTDELLKMALEKEKTNSIIGKPYYFAEILDYIPSPEIVLALLKVFPEFFQGSTEMKKQRYHSQS